MQRRPADGVVDGPMDHNGVDDNSVRSTGLLTRFVPHGLRNSALYRMFLRLTRVLQFLSSVISLGLFSQRLAKVYRLVNSIKARRGVNKAYGAVEGILAAAVLYTLITTILSLLKKNSSPGSRKLRWLWVIMDILFVGAFIAVAVLTRPNGGNAGPRHCYGRGRLTGGNGNDITGNRASRDDSCDLPWGTFILAIISTILHAITAAFHEVRDHHRRTIAAHEAEKGYNHNGAVADAPLTAPVGGHAGTTPVTGTHGTHTTAAPMGTHTGTHTGTHATNTTY